MKNINTKTWERVKDLFTKMRQFGFAPIADVYDMYTASAEMHSLCDFVLRLMNQHELDATLYEAKDLCRSQIKITDSEAGWARVLDIAASNRYNSQGVLGTCSTTHDLSNCTFNKLGICVFVNYLLTEGGKSKDLIARYLKRHNLNIDDFIFFDLPDEQIRMNCTPFFIPPSDEITSNPPRTIRGNKSKKSNPKIAAAEYFFNLLYSKIPKNNFAYFIKFKGGTKIFSFDVSDATQRFAMAKKAVELSELGVDVWHSVNPVCVKPSNKKRGDETVVSYQTAIVVDIDIAGDAHKSGNLASSFDEAKSFLPFSPSLIIDSGFGLHAYYLFDEPIKITDQNRDQLKRRNNLLLDVIRQRANGKTIDGVGDLPRIMRTPSTFNYKLGKDNAPLCHVVDDTGLLFNPADFDERLNAFFTPPDNVFLTPPVQSTNTAQKNQQRASCASHAANFIDDRDFDLFRARRMLDFFSPAPLTYDEWLAVGMALKNIGCDCSDWENWSRSDERFKVGECEHKWNGFNRNGCDIGTLYHFARQGGYDAKEIYREWYDLHPNLKPSASRNMDEKMKHDLDDAIIWLDTLEPENFTADDAHNPDNLRAVALAQAFGYDALAEKFFSVLKGMKKDAASRQNDAKSGLTEDLSPEEKAKLNVALQAYLPTIRQKVNTLRKAFISENRSFVKQLKQEQHAQAAKAKAQNRARQVAETIALLTKLREQYRNQPTKELADQIRQIILQTLDSSIDKSTGDIKFVRNTQKNANLIFSFDPVLDGLFGRDEFQQADVLLKAPPWRYDRYVPFNRQPCIGTEWRDTDDAETRTYLRDVYTEFSSKQLILDNITSYSNRNRFHPVKDYFNSLPAWDGTKRAEKLFVDFLRADDTPFTREVTLNWLTAAIARIFNPGCRYQTALVLHGNQGIGKSYIIERIGGQWYSAIIDDVDDPHILDAIKNIWIGEFKEMAAMKKVDIDHIKSFIERSEDNRRFSYDRRTSKIKRHCVFAITVNDDMFLSDMTGNRRYMIIHCNSKPRDYVEGLTDDYIKQVWAEVYAHYNELFADGFDEKKLALSRDAQIQSDSVAENYLRDDGMTSEIKAYLDTPILPLPLWHLLTRDERHDFHKSGRLVMLDALTEFNHRRRARGGRPDIVQRDVDAITSCLKETQQKFWLRIEQIKFQGRDVDEYTLYGSELRQHICAVEIYNECFGNDRRKSPTRINEILNNLDGWSLGTRIQKGDPAYLDQKKVFYRND